MTEATQDPNSSEVQPTPATAPEPNAGSSSPATFTQADVDRIVGERARRASEAAITKLLADLGIESADKLKAEIEAKRKRDEAELTEQEKLTKQLEALQAEKEAALADAKKAQQDVLDTQRDSAIKIALTGTDKAQSILTLLKSEHADMVAAVLNEDGTIAEKAVSTLVETARKEYAGMFKSTAPGSGSHNGGRTTPPDRNKILDNLPKVRL